MSFFSGVKEGYVWKMYSKCDYLGEKLSIFKMRKWISFYFLQISLLVHDVFKSTLFCLNDIKIRYIKIYTYFLHMFVYLFTVFSCSRHQKELHSILHLTMSRCDLRRYIFFYFFFTFQDHSVITK